MIMHCNTVYVVLCLLRDQVLAVKLLSMPPPPEPPAAPPPPSPRRPKGANPSGIQTKVKSAALKNYGSTDPGVILHPGPAPARVVTDMSALFIVLDLCGKGGGPAVTEQALGAVLFDGLTPLSDYVGTCSYGKARLDRSNSRIVTISLPCNGTGKMTRQ